jgi:hypothetical protein
LESDTASSGIFVLEDQSSTDIPTLFGQETVAAFIGPAPRGPVDIPVAVRSVGEYLKRFGSRDKNSRLQAYLEHFFDNGGTLAVVVRVCHSPRRNQIHLPTDGGSLVLEALHPGPLEYLRASVDYDGIAPDATGHFNLTVHRLDGGERPAVVEQEIFPAVSADPADPDYIGYALHRSVLVRLRDAGATGRPIPTLGPGAVVNPDYVYADGTRLPAEELSDYDLVGSQRECTGLYALEQVARVDLICVIPPRADFPLGPVARFAAERYCRRRQALLLVEPPAHWQFVRDVVNDVQRNEFASPNVVTCFPMPGDSSILGALAGALAARDQSGGAWTARENAAMTLRCKWQPHVELHRNDLPVLIRAGVNPITAAAPGWVELHGCITTARGSGMSPDWSALHLRRTALFAISGVVQNSRWVVFRGSSADDRADLRRQLEAFLGELQAQGALAGVSPREGWFVREPVLREDGLEIEFGIALRRAREFLHFRVTQQGGETEIREFGWQPHLAAAV